MFISPCSLAGENDQNNFTIYLLKISGKYRDPKKASDDRVTCYRRRS